MGEQDLGVQYVLTKIETVETKLDTQVEKISNKLDQLVDIMRTVAQLQEREARNSEDITELRKALKDSIDSQTKTIIRLHERLDKQDDASKQTEKETNRNLSTIFKDVDQRLDKLGNAEDTKHQTLAMQVHAVDARLNKLINRGIGAWAAIGTLMFIVQLIGGYLLNTMREDTITYRSQVQNIEKRLTETEHIIRGIQHDLDTPRFPK